MTGAKHFYDIDDVLRVIPFSRTTLYRMLAAGKFPQPIPKDKLDVNRLIWKARDVEGWIDTVLNGESSL